MFEQRDIVHTYTRAQAIADGVLVDVSEMAREAGFKIPVALTSAAWGDCVEWSEADTKKTGMPQDEAGRLWDVLWMAGLAARQKRNSNGSRVQFELRRVERGHRRATRVTLVMAIGPGDEAEPVITIMEPGED
ncbi:MAG: hypothetical protein J0I77_01915 [Rudaea sp.]|uniref:DUF6573 family protein n=1 Tax=unclassified Rudaea TaxID=2627037 RepID=UPI0010F98DA6|nr:MULTISPECIES: DUF6573 family protein [unclassified Rudaea]MBN8884451.1 hypothetical protein [Rudaea sp.]